jgi:NCS1 family nucleobase:cation symporter-1
MIADYFVLRKCRLNVDALYLHNGEYSYSNGVNWRAVAALAVGIAVALCGLAFPPLRWLYDYAWFVGFLVAGMLYLILTGLFHVTSFNVPGSRTAGPEEK